MPEQTRETLYKHFSAGQLPTEAHFRDLVDSMLNMQSEGFRKTPEYGMQVMSAAGKADPIWAAQDAAALASEMTGAAS